MPHAAFASSDIARHDDDFVLWSQEQARLLREGRFGHLDVAHLVDAVEALGHGQREAIEHRMIVLLAQLLKWKYQPGERSANWRASIGEQRRQIAGSIRKSPSLRGYPAEIFERCYPSGRLRAAEETGIDPMLFPDRTPFELAEALDDGFLPREPDLEAHD